MSTIAQYARAWKSVNNTSYVYVDSFAGDDVRGLGTQAFPFQTLNKAVVWANANNKNAIVCRGYFSESIANGYYRNVYSDQFGDFIFDGQNIYTANNLSLSYSNEKTGCIVTNLNGALYSQSNYCIFLNVFSGSQYLNVSFSACKGVDYSNLLEYGSGYIQYNNSRVSFIDYFNATRCSGSNTKCIFDNCKIYLDKNSSSSLSLNTCLFRVNCTFWKKNATTGVDERVDTDSMTAAQKQAAVMDWINNGTCYTGYYKFTFTNCQWTDNKIFNCPDNDRSGTNWDFSLIYGTKEAQPACYMDGGKHIGAFPPAIKIEFKNTADLTTSMYEVEIKETDKISNDSGTLSLASDFAGATIFSKPMLIPAGAQFNGFNVSLFPDAANSGIFVTGQTDSIDMSDADKITLASTGIALTANVCYLVRVDAGTTAVYAGTAYTDKMVLMATDSTTLATKNGSGNAYLYPINHPSIWQNVQFKICETANIPDDFKTNDTAYPWFCAECFSKPCDPRGTYETGLRCIRVGDLNSGAIDVGSDGKPLTSAHPEYYNATNQARPKYFVRANYVLMKITITRFFS